MAAVLEASTRALAEAASTISRGGPVPPVVAAAQVLDNELLYITTHAAYAAPAIRKELEYKPFDVSKLKGGKVCIPYITTECKAGDQCPNYHAKKNKVCVLFNTTKGCDRKGKCNFSHELIGKDACEAILTYSTNRRNQLKAGGGASGSSGGKGGGKGGSSNFKPKNKSGTDEVVPKKKLEKSKEKCWHRHNSSKPRSCKYGDRCSFNHGEVE